MIAANEMGWDFEPGGVRARIPRARLVFGGMCIAICQGAIGLGPPVDSQRRHVVSTAKVAGRMFDDSVRTWYLKL